MNGCKMNHNYMLCILNLCVVCVPAGAFEREVLFSCTLVESWVNLLRHSDVLRHTHFTRLKNNIDWFVHYRNLRLGYNTLLLWLIPGDIYGLCSHRQCYTLPSQAASPSSCPNTSMPSRNPICTIYWWSLVWPSQGMNPQPTPWWTDKLITKSFWRDS